MKSKDDDLLSVVLQCLDVGITVQDKKGEIIYANDAAASMIGFRSVLDLINAPLTRIREKFILYDKKGRPLDYNKLPGRKALENKKPSQTTLQFQKGRSSEKHWAQIKSVPVLDTSNNVEYVVNTFLDITKSKKEDERVNHFIATASHELKTPLAGIKAFNQLVARKFISQRFDNLPTFFARIDEKVDEVTKIINDFLDSTKIRAGVFDFNPEVFDFDEFVDTTIKDLQSIFPAHKIIKKGNAKRKIVGDRSRIRQVLTNLLGNARKYSPQSKEIVVTVAAVKKGVRVTVQDTGIGISQSELKKIFEPFYRGGKKYTGNVGGLGLGLHISSYIVKLHGGSMGVESEVGVGSTFHFTLPLMLKKYKKNNHF